MEPKKENKRALQSWLATAINATRPPGSRYADGDFEIWNISIPVDNLPYTKQTLSTNKFAHQLNTILDSTGNKIRLIHYDFWNLRSFYHLIRIENIVPWTSIKSSIAKGPEPASSIKFPGLQWSTCLRYILIKTSNNILSHSPI